MMNKRTKLKGIGIGIGNASEYTSKKTEQTNEFRLTGYFVLLSILLSLGIIIDFNN